MVRCFVRWSTGHVEDGEVIVQAHRRETTCRFWVDEDGRDPSPGQPIIEYPGSNIDQMICQSAVAGAAAGASQTVYGPGADDAQRLAFYGGMFLPDIGPWDFKSESVRGGPSYEGYGNFVFGAVGTALGFTPYEIYQIAGAAQIGVAYLFREGSGYDSDFGFPFFQEPYGDDYRDRPPIDAGIEYAKNHPCTRVFS